MHGQQNIKVLQYVAGIFSRS